MKAIAYTLLVCAFIASAVADYATDALINKTYVGFIQQFDAFVQKTSYEAVLQAYDSDSKGGRSNSSIDAQSLEEIKQLSSNITSALMAQYKLIAYKIIYDAGYNTKGNYYIFDNTTKKWHLPNQAAPATPVDGVALNSKQLSKELENAFIGLMPKKEGSSGLQRRMFGRIFSSRQTTSFIRNIEHLPPTNVLDEIAKFKTTNTKLGGKDEQLLKALEEGATAQKNWRESASEGVKAADGTVEVKGLKDVLDEVDSIKSYHDRKSELETKLKELLDKSDKTDIDKADIDVINRELKRVGDFIRRDANALFRSRVTGFIVYFFA